MKEGKNELHFSPDIYNFIKSNTLNNKTEMDCSRVNLTFIFDVSIEARQQFLLCSCYPNKKRIQHTADQRLENSTEEHLLFLS